MKELNYDINDIQSIISSRSKENYIIASGKTKAWNSTSQGYEFIDNVSRFFYSAFKDCDDFEIYYNDDEALSVRGIHHDGYVITEFYKIDEDKLGFNIEILDGELYKINENDDYELIPLNDLKKGLIPISY